MELENLLPYNIEYRIYDKEADQNWRSYLRKGGVMPVHSVELDHMVLLNVTAQDTGALLEPLRYHFADFELVVFKPSDFSIINADGSGDFEIEKKIVLRDAKDRKLYLGLNYMYGS